MIKSILCIVFMCACIQMQAQPQARTGATKNTVYATVGSTVTFMAMALNFERNLIINPAFQFLVRGGFGRYSQIWSDEGRFMHAAIVTLHGKTYNLIETAWGVTRFRSNYGFSKQIDGEYVDMPFRWYPSGYIGYRYKNPRKHFMLRAGIGWPDQLSVGLGFSF